jgi:hypothetical protein
METAVKIDEKITHDKATPRPWTVQGPFDGASRQRYEIQSPDVVVAELYVDFFDHAAHGAARADGHLIVEAVNSHDALKAQNAELVEVLEKVLSQAVPVAARCGCCGHSRREHAKWCAVPFARAALAKAGVK